MTPVEPCRGDSFGRALLDQLDGTASSIVIERDDGFVDADASDYFGDVVDDGLWGWIRGRLGRRVVDLGAGAGRGALRLQAEGVDVLALDVSRGALDVCARRGVRNTFLGTIEDLASANPAPFDSVLALGNNLGLLGSPETAGSFFEAARAIGTDDVRVVGTMLDPYVTESRVHLDYHDRNRSLGRPAGKVTIRVRYQNEATDWFSLLWASPGELSELCVEHGWVLAATELAGLQYAAELRPR